MQWFVYEAMGDENLPADGIYSSMSDAGPHAGNSSRMCILGSLVYGSYISGKIAKPNCPSYITVVSINHSSKVYYYGLSFTYNLFAWTHVRLCTVRAGRNDGGESDVLSTQFLNASL